MNEADDKHITGAGAGVSPDTVPITPNRLRELIGDVLSDHYRLPPVITFIPLARTATTLRDRCRLAMKNGWTDEDVQSDELRRRAYDALQTLAEVLPIIRVEIEENPTLSGFDDSPDEPWRAANLHQLNLLEAIIGEARQYSALVPRQELSKRAAPKMVRYSSGGWSTPLSSSIRGKTKWWHEFVGALADEFCRAIQPRNPTRRIGNSVGGPLPRFLAAAIPHISGETPTKSAVRGYLEEVKWQNPT
jgi:hypothetical protein